MLRRVQPGSAGELESYTRNHRINPKLTQAGWTVTPFDESVPLSVRDKHAVTEYETACGPADYALCDGGAVLGVAEATKPTVGSVQHRRTYFEECNYGAGRPHLSFDLLRSTPFNTPSLSKQAEIVSRIEALLALANRIEQRVKAGTKHTEKVKQSVPAKAFRGELVPMEAELARQEGWVYEPANVLLECIRAERIMNWPAKRRRSSTAQSAM